MARVGLSAGHGAGDAGAVYQGLQEQNLTRSITNRAADILRKHSVGVVVVPDNLDLVQTIQWLNNQPVNDLVVEVHINSGNGSGVEGWYYQGGNNQSSNLSSHLANALAAETGLPNRGIKDETTNRHGRLGFVHDTRDTASLVECGFIDGDYNFLNSASGIEKMARGVARGCLSFLGLAWKPELLNSTPPTPAPVVSDTTWAKIAKESKEFVFGYKTHGTVTQRMSKVIEAYKRNGVTK